MNRLAAVGLAAAIGFGLLGSAPPADTDCRKGFPHDAHAGLFPTCVACHNGVDTGESFYTVKASDCAACHDGDTVFKVGWTSPAVQTHAVSFDHVLHLDALDGECAICHQRPDSDERMDVVLPDYETTCRDCHSLEEHFSEQNECIMCHKPASGGR